MILQYYYIILCILAKPFVVNTYLLNHITYFDLSRFKIRLCTYYTPPTYLHQIIR